jgi:heat-inducible transcriptional repressor
MLPPEGATSDLDIALALLQPLVVGHPVRIAAERVQAARGSAGHPDPAFVAIAAAIADDLEEFRQNRLVMAGSATLAQRAGDFRGSIHPLLEAIEEQVTLLKLMSEMADDDEGLATSIGRENAAFGLGEASIVTSTYDATVGRARVGLMGPTRMDYPRNLAAARAVARYLTRVLEEDESR